MVSCCPSSCDLTKAKQAEFSIFNKHKDWNRKGILMLALGSIFSIFGCGSLLGCFCGASSILFVGLVVGAILIGSVALGIRLMSLYRAYNCVKQHRIGEDFGARSRSLSSSVSSESDLSLEFELNVSDLTYVRVAR
ncbi:hypothetical protein C6H88_02580 [Chlamydia muridarum str. Nigg]|nr:hypothetical protein [Chlamydia muridarum]UFW99755.1 hypothetical protein FTM85_02685 [Chlamydia trachomatis]AID38021.1 putative inclusion membrane protein [Chlamydia muridarum str. Nigg 2 MCR]AIT90683.1 hypothetical protein NC80_02510 [Chlamydia muridarum]AIT91572.1 hypothetical protein NC81_02525 [Chlamydia muridarum]AIW23450.1 hypothetical protein DNC_02530 [Chlamydia muridarum]